MEIQSSQNPNKLDDALLKMQVGQLIITHFHGEEANEEAKRLIQDAQVGGIIYYNWSNKLESPEKVRKLSQGLQALVSGSRQLFIAADQEGGVVRRMDRGFTVLPGNHALGVIGEPSYARKAAEITAKELKAVGVNMNLAPVVDASEKGCCNPIGVRSIGPAEKVSLLAREMVEAFNKKKIVSVSKHFVGLTKSDKDSHNGLPVVSQSLEELEKEDIHPFQELAKLSPCVMTAHALVKALDEDRCCTLSKKALGYLREKVGFEGAIVADSLVMKGVLNQTNGSVEEAAKEAINAGCDILMLGGKLLNDKEGIELRGDEVVEVCNYLVAEVKAGRIPQSRIEDAYQRVCKIKDRFLKPAVASVESRAFAAQVAAAALKSMSNDPSGIYPLEGKKVAVFAPQLLRTSMEQTSILKLGRETTAWFSDLPNPSKEELDVAKRQAQEADLVVVCSYNAWNNAKQKEMIEAMLGLKKPVILIAARDPEDAKLFPTANLTLITHSPTAPSIQAACDRIEQLGAFQ